MSGTTSTALPSFSHDQPHKTDAAKRRGGADGVTLKKLNTHWTLTETSDMHDVTSENTTTYYYYTVQVTHPLAI